MPADSTQMIVSLNYVKSKCIQRYFGIIKFIKLFRCAPCRKCVIWVSEKARGLTEWFYKDFQIFPRILNKVDGFRNSVLVCWVIVIMPKLSLLKPADILLHSFKSFSFVMADVKTMIVWGCKPLFVWGNIFWPFCLFGKIFGSVPKFKILPLIPPHLLSACKHIFIVYFECMLSYIVFFISCN